MLGEMSPVGYRLWFRFLRAAEELAHAFELLVATCPRGGLQAAVIDRSAAPAQPILDLSAIVFGLSEKETVEI